MLRSILFTLSTLLVLAAPGFSDDRAGGSLTISVRVVAAERLTVAVGGLRAQNAGTLDGLNEGVEVISDFTDVTKPTNLPLDIFPEGASTGHETYRLTAELSEDAQGSWKVGNTSLIPGQAVDITRENTNGDALWFHNYMAALHAGGAGSVKWTLTPGN